ncbi:hypothetical protein [Paraclostridium bifermentans]
MLEDLLDRDKLWEYLSIAFQKSVEEDIRKKQEDEQLQSLMSMVKTMSGKMDILQKAVNEAPKIASPASGSSVAVSSAASTPAEEPVRKPRERKKVDMNKLNAMGAGGANPFLAAASRAKKFK